MAEETRPGADEAPLTKHGGPPRYDHDEIASVADQLACRRLPPGRLTTTQLEARLAAAFDERTEAGLDRLKQELRESQESVRRRGYARGSVRYAIGVAAVEQHQHDRLPDRAADHPGAAGHSPVPSRGTTSPPKLPDRSPGPAGGPSVQARSLSVQR